MSPEEAAPKFDAYYNRKETTEPTADKADF
jgi:hypothetical protein